MDNHTSSIPSEYRVFVALDLPVSIFRFVADTVHSLQENNMDWIRWTRPENIHLTLKFLGNTKVDKLLMVTKVMETLSLQNTVMHLTVGGLGVFPNLHHPRILWIGIQTSKKLWKLQIELEQGLLFSGFQADEKPFSPHLTIGRFIEKVSREQTAKTIKYLEGRKNEGRRGEVFNTITMYQSVLKPEGPIYKILHRVKLCE